MSTHTRAHAHSHSTAPATPQHAPTACSCGGECASSPQPAETTSATSCTAAGDSGAPEAACACHAPITLDAAVREDEEGMNWRRQLLLPGLLFGLGLVLREPLTVRYGPVPFYAVMIAAYLLCGIPVLKDAVAAMRRRDFFNEFTLMSLATLVAIGIGEMAEAVGVMLFYSIGEAVQEKAAGRSRRSIASLLASKPETARVMEAGEVRLVAPEAVAIGSSVLVKPGEKIPLDGKVLSGNASLDMSSLTGESLPVGVGAGDAVYSGAISLDGDLVVRTTAGYKDSMVGKILAMVENAVAMKSKTERFITVFARYYTPTVAALVLAVAVLPPLLAGQPWQTWIYRGLVLLVVSCPCALFLSVPLAFFAGIGAASRHGMLVKGGQVFDALAKSRKVVFDKTGTLTQGKLSLSGIEPAAGTSEADLLRFAALAESRSDHPIARAITAAAGGDAVFHEDVAIKNVGGKGIVAAAGDDEILVGNAALLRDKGVAFTETASKDVAAYVAVNGAYRGCLTFADHLKPDTVEALRSLKAGQYAEGVYMLTGDREATAKSVADEVGLDGYRAGLLPDEKVKAFRELSPDGRAMFVGDGVNDAPVLAASGVGVAMGALGSAAAVEAADAVILDDSPARIPHLFRIARRTHRIAGENIAFALAIKAVIMALGVLGHTGLWAAVFADVGVALLAVLNSLRLTRE
ncbi:MAG: cadmium-translocating P-type ATPase [Planctomycetaceae bacterium]|nr:cadmium-translocating P-type ATPase [Planctomycetaceae bacterium]